MVDSDLALALESMPRISEAIGDRQPAFFLDFDGTLAPIVSRPELAEVSAQTREALISLAKRYLVCIASGRGLEDIQNQIGLGSVFYAADHGHRVIGPAGSGTCLEVGAEYREVLQAAARELDGRLVGIGGVTVEAKGLSLSVHYRLVAERERPMVRDAVALVGEAFPALRLTRGKMVYEMRPPGAWNKGLAMLWLLERLGLGRGDVCPICLGDDLTDEDMFVAIDGWGVSLVIGDPGRPTRAGYLLRDPDEATAFLEILATTPT